MSSSLEQLSALASMQCPAPLELIKENELKSSNDPSSSVVPPPAQIRQTSVANNNRCSDWARQITLEERKYIRDRIKAAYAKKMHESYNDLLDTCSAIEEELIFSSAPSRLDYYKIGVQYEKRVSEKKNHLKNGLTSVNVTCKEEPVTVEEAPRQIKRAKTNY
eukprot:gene25534-33330_t